MLIPYPPPASATVAGLVTTGAQTLAGQKTLSSAPILSALSASAWPYLDASKVLASIDVGAQRLVKSDASKFPAASLWQFTGTAGNFQDRLNYNPQGDSSFANDSLGRAINLQSNTPGMFWYTRGAGTDAKGWDFLASGNNFSIRLINDAASTALTVFNIGRTDVTSAVLTLTSRLTMADGQNIDCGTTTGTKIGLGTTRKIGFFNATPVVQPSAYTQTYSTADKTHANLTSATLTDNTAGTANTTLQALADGTIYANDVAAIRNNFADLAASNNAIIVDLTDLKQLVNAVIDDLQALGLAA